MRIEADSQFSSMIFEDIVVGNSSKLYANGMVHGNIQVESGSELYLSGMLNTDSEVPAKVVKKKGCYINSKQY